MDPKLLTEAILGNRPDLFEQIWPIYRQFLEETKAGNKVEDYFLDTHILINDFYRWLGRNQKVDVLSLIDRRHGQDRRGDVRPDAPGRREEDKLRAQNAQKSSIFFNPNENS